MKHNDICSLEAAADGKNILSSEESDVSSADHLVVMVNGILERLDTSLGYYAIDIN